MLTSYERNALIKLMLRHILLVTFRKICKISHYKQLIIVTFSTFFQSGEVYNYLLYNYLSKCDEKDTKNINDEL